jgi:signal peptidase I
MTIETPVSRPPRPWLAALLSIFVPGLGLVYTGNPLHGLAVYLASLFVGALAVIAVMSLNSVPANLIIASILFAIAVLFPVVASYISARRTRERFVSRSYNKWYIYAALLALFITTIQPAIWNAVTTRWVEAFRLPNNSMAPTLRAGDYLLVRKGVPEPLRGKLVVFVPPHDPARKYLKRVIALPGDTIAMQGKALFLNGKQVDEPFVQHVDRNNDVFAPSMYWQGASLAGVADSGGYKPTRDNWGPLLIPPDHVFVLGDNRDDSEDSRYFGFVGRSAILGYPKRLYFSSRPADRPGRVGGDVSKW